MHCEYAIVGGGIVGLSVAAGLLKRGHRVCIFDEGDIAYRASRGNFGLVWVQGKGLQQPAYARWSQRSASLWPEFAGLLEQEIGSSLYLQQKGGYTFFLDEQSLEKRAGEYAELAQHLDDYPFEVLGHNNLRKEEPHIGPDVVGAVLHHQDGHVNSLELLRSLSLLVQRLGAQLRLGSTVSEIEPIASSFRVHVLNAGYTDVERVVLCAGLGATKLASRLGFKAPVRAQRGQVLITEKLPPLLYRPSGVTRQVNEGGVQIGASEEEVGLDDAETLNVTAKLAEHAIALYPTLANANLVRSWASLRIMSPDGLPIYQQSLQHPGAFFITCHSGVTLAAAHNILLPLWLEANTNAPDLSPFAENRFDV